MKRRSGERNQNLDSLLDTMANVVGILVVVMAFTQIQVGEAVRRIHDVEVARVRSAGEALAFAGRGALREVDRLEDRLRDRDGSAARVRAELKRLDTASSEENAAALYPGVEQATIVAAILRETAQERETKDELDSLRASRRRLEIHLSRAKDAFAEAAHEVRLPDPRPAPAGTEERVLFCRYGRVVSVDLESLLDILNQHLRKAASSPLAGGLSTSLVVNHFNGVDVGDRDFRWRLSDQAGLGIAARLDFRSEKLGESRSELIVDDSAFRRTLSRFDPRAHYLRFFVWSDSFATYLRARQIAEEQGFSVGWQAYDLADEHGGILQANVLRDAIPID